MAISWGAWEYSGGNGMRVGLDVSWEAITTGEAAATCTTKVYTENQYSYSDGQRLNYGGSIGGSTSFTNNDGGAATLRATKTYTYNYGASEYGSSPGNRTFTATLAGAYNGVTPSKSVTSAIPARPYAAPNAPTNAAASRISDTTTRITWTWNATAQKPITNHWLYESTNGGSFGAVSTSISGSATSYDHGTAANTKYRFRVYADNSVGTSAYDETGDIYTTPAVPASTPTNTAGTGAQRVVTWTNKSGYTEYSTEVWVSRDNGATWSLLTTVATGVTTYTDTAASAAQATGYKVRHQTTAGTQGTLYSAYTANSTFTPGVTSPPNAPTGLTPNGDYLDPTVAQDLSWTHNPTDGSAQTKFTLRHRVQGSPTWTTITEVTSSVSSWSLPANTYTTGQVVEWQVTTKGADATGSAWSSSAVFTMLVTKLIPAAFNLGTNNIEADVSGYDWIYLGTAGAPALLNGWSDYGGAFASPRFCRRGGVVYIQGLVKTGTLNSVIFTLPVGFRPSQTLLMSAIQSTFDTGAASAGTAHTHAVSQSGGRLDVKADGSVAQAGAATNAWQSICVSFPADQ